MSSTPVADVVGVYQAMSAHARATGAVNLAQGVPEPVHDARWRAAVAAEIHDGHLQYTPTRGHPALRGAIASSYRADPDHVVVTSGCTESLAAALVASARLGARTVVWLEPFYSYYPGLARLAGMRADGVPVDLSGPSPRLDPDALRAAIAPHGERAVLLLNTPHNPSGLVLDHRGWRDVLDVVAGTGCSVLLDDVYRDFRFGPPPAPYEALLRTGRAAVAGSLSKSLAATGLRLGWLLAPPGLADLAESVHMHLSNCSPEFLQRAAVRLFAEVDDAAAALVTDRYRRRRDLLVPALRAAGLHTVLPEGGHFVLARPADGTDPGSTALAFGIAESTGVVPLPLEGFFGTPDPRWVRFSYAVAPDVLDEACRRLAARPPGRTA